MSVLTDQDDVNKALISIGEVKYEGLNKQKLILAVIETMKHNNTMKIAKKYLAGESNVDQINFAKLVWNASCLEIRTSFLTADNNWFIKLAGDADMTNILTAALDKHEGGGTGGGDAAGYLAIAERVADLKIKQAEAEDPFNEQMTDRELATIQKFDDLAAKRDENGPGEVHHPNESAVTYCYLLGRLILYAELNLKSKTVELVSIVDDILHFFAAHGQKSMFVFNKVLSKFTSVPGPKSKVDIQPFVASIVAHENFVTASSKGEGNKLLANHKLSLKRVIRLVYICTKYKTVWGIMNAKTDFHHSIKKLYELEASIEAPDMNSLAIIWYLCIGRENINAVMVDHWEKSAGSELAMLLGNDSPPSYGTPEHVFPLDKSTADNFKMKK